MTGSPVPAREWTWAHQPNYHRGVHTREGKLIWFIATNPEWSGSAAGEQSYADFLANGPLDGDIPPDALAELSELLLVAGSR